PRILKEVPGIGVVLIGEGDLSQNLGYPRQYEHPVVADAMRTILRICQEHNVVCGHPHVDTRNVGRLVEEGYRFLMAAPTRILRMVLRQRGHGFPSRRKTPTIIWLRPGWPTAPR